MRAFPTQMRSTLDNPTHARNFIDCVKSRQAPIWTYVGVGVTFGLALIGIYQLVGMLAH